MQGEDAFAVVRRGERRAEFLFFYKRDSLISYGKAACV
jgi:hypothetical protein